VRTNLFSGEVENTFVLQDLIDMFKIGWRSLEGCTLHSKHWRSDAELTKQALDHITTLLRIKFEEASASNAPAPKVTLSIVPPEAPANEN
jgi:hypothetical protein